MVVVYTAHGFHFYKGALFKNWLMFYPVEWILAYITDCLIVINHEDELIARKMPVKLITKIDGVGVSKEIFNTAIPVEKASLNLPEYAFVFLCVGELSERKNQRLLLRSFANAVQKCTNAVLLLAGEGGMRDKYQRLADDLNLSGKVIFLGWRDDIPALILMANVVVSAAKQEGLPVNLVEAMIAGKAIIASGCRGNRELAEQAGIVADSEKEFTDAMIYLYSKPERAAELGIRAKAASGRYESAAVDGKMLDLYKGCL
jgi:glycosyltransferase EpsD